MREELAVLEARLRRDRRMTWPLALSGALVATILLFDLMQRLLHSGAQVAAPLSIAESVTLVQSATPQSPSPSAALPAQLPAAPASPPPASPPLAAAAAPAAAAAMSMAVPDVQSVQAVGLPLAAAAVGPTLNAGGAFGGFAGGGRGNGEGGGGGGGSGYGRGEDFQGETLVALSTARPQISEWAYRHGIEGWVELAFTVDVNGHVQNVRIIDAQPRGIFEAAAVNSIVHWIYPAQKHAIEVKQRVDFKLSDYQYNWQ